MNPSLNDRKIQAEGCFGAAASLVQHFDRYSEAGRLTEKFGGSDFGAIEEVVDLYVSHALETQQQVGASNAISRGLRQMEAELGSRLITQIVLGNRDAASAAEVLLGDARNRDSEFVRTHSAAMEAALGSLPGLSKPSLTPPPAYSGSVVPSAPADEDFPPFLTPPPAYPGSVVPSAPAEEDFPPSYDEAVKELMTVARDARVDPSQLLDAVFPVSTVDGSSDFDDICTGLERVMTVMHHFKVGSAYKSFWVPRTAMRRAERLIEAGRNTTAVDLDLLGDLAITLESLRGQIKSLVEVSSKRQAENTVVKVTLAGDVEEQMDLQVWLEVQVEPVLRKLSNRVDRLAEALGFQPGWQNGLQAEDNSEPSDDGDYDERYDGHTCVVC